jgi:imidazolonepropionase
MAEGVTSLEIKSGYGLSALHEARCLRVARQLGEELPLTVRTTCLSAHALPPEFDGRPDDYIAAVCAWLPSLHAEKLVDAVDAFCERIAFTPAQTRRVFETAHCARPAGEAARRAAERHGRRRARRRVRRALVRAPRVPERGGVRAMAEGGQRRGAAAGRVLLPARDEAAAGRRAARGGRADRDRDRPQPGLVADALAAPDAEHGVHAVPAHARGGAARHDGERRRARSTCATAARSRPGRRADFVAWNVEHPNELSYWFGHNPCARVVVDGRPRGDVE